MVSDPSVIQAGEARAFAGEDGERGVSPKILVSYAPKSSLLVHLQLSEGYRPGGFNTGARMGQVFGSFGAPRRICQVLNARQALCLWMIYHSH